MSKGSVLQAKPLLSVPTGGMSWGYGLGIESNILQYGSGRTSARDTTSPTKTHNTEAPQYILAVTRTEYAIIQTSVQVGSLYISLVGACA